MSDGDRQNLSEVRKEVTRALIPTVPEHELEQRICDRFAESDLYAFAWVGRHDSSEERVAPTVAAGTDVDALEEISLEGDSPRQGVVRAAVETRAVQVERGLPDDPPSADWGDHARDHGYQSVAVVPLVHEEALHGVLYLAADRPDGFDADEQDTLATLGETIGYALDDVRTDDEAERDEGGHDETDHDRETHEQAVRESERRLRAIFDGTDEFIGLLEPDGTVLDANRASLEWDGATRENSVGVPFWDASWFVNTPEASEKAREAVARAAEGEFVRQELSLRDASGEVTTLDFSLHPVGDEDGGVDFLVPEGREITERKERERELQQYKTVANTASDVIVSIDERSVIQSVNPAVEDVFGYARDELVGEPLTMLMPEPLRERHDDGIQQYIRTGERALDWDYLELPGLHRDGHEIPLAVSFSEYEHDGERFFTGIIRDNTERKRFERALTNLHDASRDLIQAESRVDVGRRTVDAARELLGFDGVAVYLFDDTENALRPAASTEYVDDVFGGALPTFTPEDTAITWEAFINGETLTLDDVLESDDVHRRDTPLRSGVWVPLGDHGVLSIVSEDVGGFDQQTSRLADHLAATAEAALDRVEREESLRDQERELGRRNEQLQNLNRTNDIIREIDQALVDATTREEIEQAVCGLLTRDERFAFAWIGEADDEAVTPLTWAGDDQGYLDAVSLTASGDGGEPAVTTAATGNATLVSNVAANLRDEPWRKTALARDLQSVIGIPLRYNGMEYGVLTVYATRADAFDELSQAILGELGETIANAMNFIDTRRALLSDTVVELELEIRGADDPLVHLARETGGELEFQGIVPQAAGTARIFVTTSGTAADTVRDAAAESTRIENVSFLSGGNEGGETRFEVTVSGSTIPSTLVECGAVVQSIRIADTETDAVVELPHSVDVRTFVDRLEATHPDTELIARRDRERADQSQGAFEAALVETLTRRQLETLQTAYHSGYFEWPRERTGEEVAQALDITQPTFNGHLRSAERKLCAMLFDGSQSPAE